MPRDSLSKQQKLHRDDGTSFIFRRVELVNRKVLVLVSIVETNGILCTISKTRASVSSGYPNTEKQVKARGRRPSAFIVARCLDTPMKHELEF